MKQFSKLQLKILHLLSDGNCHPGELIGAKLGISRTTLWKHIIQLAELGLAIEQIPQQGYQLSQPMIPLEEQLIRQHLESRHYNKPLNFHLFAELGSTNQFLKELAINSAINICCAEKQTQGRGRFGRHWLSPFGENIYFSSRWELNCCLSDLSGLSLVVSLAILASLNDSTIQKDIRIKWPNDILWGNKKLCGILIEISAKTNSCAQVIIGIGMNVNTATHEQPQVEIPWCSLYEITDKYYDRNKILANLIYQLNTYLDKFLLSGFAAFADEWQNLDYLQGQFIKVTQPTGFISGLACGVTELGQLCLRDEKDKMHYLSSGDSSLSTKV
ncbi:MAG: biotin--[acetyl-CoA-carboxylase] ligase [Tatlockia sp.]|nr:biotin--[acetyl-CoA-carboxylase] ligase [Tatlockia sp.]